MNKKQRSVRYLASCIIIIMIAIAVSLVFVFNRTSTKEYSNKLEEAQKYVEKMNYKKAEAVYLEAIKIDSRKTDAYLKLADIYLKQNKIDKFINILEKGIKNVEKDDRKKLEKKLSSIDDQIKANSMYAKKFKTYLKKYGTISEKYIDENSYAMYLEGLCYSKMLDFNNDGLEELLLVYYDQSDKEYHYDIYGFNENKIKHLESSKKSFKNIKNNVVNTEHADELYGYDGGTKCLEIYQHDNNYYIRTGSVDDFETNIFHGFITKNNFGISSVFEFDGVHKIKNKKSIDTSTYDSEINSYKEFYKLYLNQYEYYSNEELNIKGINCVLKDINETMNKLDIKVGLKSSTEFSQEKLNAYLESIKVKETPKQNNEVIEQRNNTVNTIIDENQALELAKSKYTADGYFLQDLINYNDKQYYVFNMKWKVDNHYSSIGYVFVSSDGLEVTDSYWYDQSTGKVTKI